jgi:aspartyl protease family protein
MPSASLPLILLALIGVATATLFAANPQEFVARLPEAARIIAITAVMVFVGLGLWSRSTFGRAVRHALGWLMIGGVVAVAHSNWQAIELAARRMVGELTPPIASVEPEISTGGERIVIERTKGTPFRVPVEINGAKVTMMVDTGASIVTLSHEDAKAAGINVDKLDYTVSIFTANGKSNAAGVKLDRVAIGTIERRNVRALVAREGMLERSLLGLSFLDTLTGYSIAGDRLEMRP